jgi:hypothetical protein
MADEYSGGAGPPELTISGALAGTLVSTSGVAAEQLARMTPRQLAQLTGQDGAFTLRSRPLRQTASTTYAPLEAALSAVAVEVMGVSPRIRPNPKLAENVRLIALNLYSAYRQDDRLCTAFPMAAPWYSTKRPRNPALSFRLTVEQAWGGLVALGLAELVRKGSPWGGSYSLVRATPALIDRLDREAPGVPVSALRMASPHDPIVLKGAKSAGPKPEAVEAGADNDGSERPMLFIETPETRLMRANVVRINTVNAPDRICLPEFGEDERDALFDALWGPASASWRPASPTALAGWFAETALYRSFNRGSFDYGGRFYGAAWQQMPKAWRQRILIDGEAVVELDYGSLHPRLAHHLYERVDAPEDCYAAINAPRDLVKRAVSALLNMENGTARAPRWFKVGEAGMPWASLRAAIAVGLPRIAGHFGTGIGLRLQRVDSDIAERVMLHFADQGIPCLGVHDSFIVARKHSAGLEATMRDVYRNRIGFEPVIKAG